jgi:hypothetical protein
MLLEIILQQAVHMHIVGLPKCWSAHMRTNLNYLSPPELVQFIAPSAGLTHMFSYKMENSLGLGKE